jgi:MarR family
MMSSAFLNPAQPAERPSEVPAFGEAVLIVPARPVGQRTLDGGLDYAAMLEASPGLTQAELARRLGVTPAAISQRLAKPKRVLRDHGGSAAPARPTAVCAKTWSAWSCAGAASTTRAAR